MATSRADTRRPSERRTRRAGHYDWLSPGGDKEYGMLPCEYDALLGPFHDGELLDDRRRDVEAHVAGCPECGQALRQLRGMSARFSEAGLPAMPPADKARVRRNVLRATTPTTGRSIRWARWLTAAAALVFAVSLWQIVQTHWHSPDATGNPPVHPSTDRGVGPGAPPIDHTLQSETSQSRRSNGTAAQGPKVD